MKSNLLNLIIAVLFTIGIQSVSGQTINAVGAIGGVVDVTTTGAATYTIPIDAVPGTNGIEPNISLQYNSQSGLGLLGSNWQLEGISSIRRIPQNMYLDNNITQVNLNLTDRFALDGNRLIEVQGTYGNDGTKYRTEIESFVEVTSIGSATGGPDHFELVDDNGTVYEYGNTINSKQLLGDIPLAWYINKITDCEGNYLTYTYSSSLGQVVVTEINYTGNVGAGLATYAKMTFSYNDNNVYNTGYVRGKSYVRSKLLQSITTYSQGVQVKKYSFVYDYTRLPRLTSITLTGENNIQLNPTTIEWGESTADVESYQTDVEGLGYIPFNYDGDKCTDFFYYPGTSGDWRVIVNDCQGNLGWEMFGTIDNYNFDYPIFSTDIDGDGIDEMIYATWGVGNIVKFNYLKFNIEEFSFEEVDMNISFTNGELSQILPGDLDGDGKDEVIFYRPTKTPRLTFWGLNDGVTHNEFATVTQQLRVQDNNGNRKAEIMIDMGASISMYEYNNATKAFVSIVNDNNVRMSNYHYYGDFNDDGLKDVLVIISNSNGNYSCYAKINENSTSWMWSSSGTSMPLELSFSYQFIQTPPMIGDMNGDKRDDIVVTVKQPDKNIRLDVYYSDGYKNNQLQYHKVSYYNTALLEPNLVNENYYFCTDMNGDGTSDLLYVQSLDTKFVLFFHKNEQFELMKSVTDGVGAKSTFTYIMSGLSYNYYTSNFESRSYFPLVTDIYSSNGIAEDLTRKTYTYYEVLYSLNRSKLFGFQTLRSKNNTSGLEIVSKYAMNTSFDNVDLISRDFYQGAYIKKELFTPKYVNWGKRFISYDDISDVQDLLTGVVTNTNTDVYSSDGRVQKIVSKNSRIFNNTFLSSTTTDYIYQSVVLPNSQTVKKIQSAIVTEKIAGSSELLSYTTTYNYLNGHLDNVVNSNNTSTVTTSYSQYNLFGTPGTIVKSATGLDSKTEIFGYDPTGRFNISYTNALGQTSSSSYYSATGNTKSSTDVNGLITYYYYDEFGRASSIINPDGTSVGFTRNWNAFSWFPDAVYSVKTVATASPQTEVFYDKLNREVFSSEAGVGYTQTVYNNKGQIIKKSLPFINPKTTDENKIWTTYTYYADGRPDAEVGPYLKKKYSYEGATSDKTSVTVTDQLRNTFVKKSYDLPDRIVQVQDAGGTITYGYAFKKVDNKQIKEQTITYGSNVVTLVQDLNGNILSFTDPNSGSNSSTYDAFNRVIMNTDGNGNQTSYQYDMLDRVISELHSGNGEPNKTYVYKYDIAPGNATGKLYYITINGTLDEMYYYDNLSRITTRRKVINASLYQEFFEYNSIGQLSTYKFPDNYKIRYGYNSYGELSDIHDDADNSLICDIYRNNFRKHSQCIFGNQTGVGFTYNDYGILTNIRSGDVETGLPDKEIKGDGTGIGASTPVSVGDQYRALTYTIDTKGRIERRADTRLNQYEKYTYDNLDRLTATTAGNILPLTSNTVNYGINNNGNITSGTNIGTYQYYGAKPYQVAEVIPVANCPISHATCDATYNSLNLPATIAEGIYSYTIDYGADQNRRSTVLTKTEGGVNTVLKTSRYISPSFEVEITPSGTKTIDYIMTDQGVAAIRTKTGGVASMYYVHTDQLGSYNFVMDANKNIVQSCHFDPWGNRKLYNNWSQDNTATSFMFSRGYTSHEHLDLFKIINMNARLYDPMIGRFFSPDPIIQDYQFTQSLNRYSYCQNNPVMNSDPTGLFDTGYTIDEDGNIEKVNDVGEDRYDVLYKKSEYSEEKKYDIDFSGTKTGLMILDKKIMNELKYQLGYSVYYKNGSDEFKKWYDEHRTYNYPQCRYTETSSLYDAFRVFKFVADNTIIEWAISGFSIDNKTYWALGTSQNPEKALRWDLLQQSRYKSQNEFFHMHSHPLGSLLGASGINGDQGIFKLNPQIPHYIYNVTDKTRFQYNDRDDYLNPIKIKTSDNLFN